MPIYIERSVSLDTIYKISAFGTNQSFPKVLGLILSDGYKIGGGNRTHTKQCHINHNTPKNS